MKKNIIWIFLISVLACPTLLPAQTVVPADSVRTVKLKNYLTRKLAFLDSIKPLNEPIRSALSDSFYHFALDDNNYNAFSKAMIKTVTDPVYYMALARDKLKQPALPTDSVRTVKIKAYLNRKLAFLDSIKPLKEPVRSALTDSFYHFALADTNNYRAFDKAMVKTVTDDTYYLAIASDKYKKTALVPADSLQTIKIRDYLKYKLAYLDSIKPLRVPVRNALTDLYYQYAFTDSNYIAFNKAMKKTVTDTIYYLALVHDKLKKNALTACNNAMKEMANKYQLTEDVIKKITPFQFAEKLAIAELNAGMQEESLLKDSLKQRIYDTFNDNVNVILVRYGYRKPYNRLTSVLANAALLQLSEVQKDSLQVCQLRLNQLAHAFVGKNVLERFDQRPYIVAHLPAILLPNQYYKQLLFEAQVPAYSYTQQNWEELRKYNLTNNLDSVATCKTLMEYNLKKVMISWLKDKEGKQLPHDYKAKMPTPGALIQPQLLHKLDIAKKMGYNDPAKHTLTW